MNRLDEMLVLIGKSQLIQNVYRLILQVAKTNTNVLILGESGTGKELVARILHFHSKRSGNPFIPINCAAIPSELLESELFGHEKGSFTGAHATRLGKFESANGGTLFLDEIGDMPLAMQAKLLRVLQERVFERVGGNKSIQADVRVIAATHKNLENYLKEGKFREDLYFRLNVFPITIPALRERKEDIPLLLEHFIQNHKDTNNVSVTLCEDALAGLTEYHWPGNVRELANVVERLCILYPNQKITANELPMEYHLTDNLNTNNLTTKNFEIIWESADSQKAFDLKAYLAKLEYAIITKALKQHEGIIAKAAESLGLRRTTLNEKMRKYKIIRS